MVLRTVRFREPEHHEVCYGILEGTSITRLAQPPWQGVVPRESYAANDVALMSPVDPSKIVCIGLNYQAHVAASQSADKAPERPLIFLKPPSAVIGPGDTIVPPAQSERVDYEAELGVVIGSTARNVSEEEAGSSLFGLTCVNDVTARDLQKLDGQWSRAKGFDTFCPVGPWIVSGVDSRDLLVEGLLNGEVKQSGRTSQMIFSIPYLISYISSVMTLVPGDLISTGTPSGIGPMISGDRVEVRIERVGTLVNWVA